MDGDADGDGGDGGAADDAEHGDDGDGDASDADAPRDGESPRSMIDSEQDSAAAAKEQDKLLKSKMAFDVHDELSKIECGSFAELLISRGFDEKSAFAEMQEDELRGDGMWVHKKARRRITALAELYRREIAMDERQPKTVLDKMAEVNDTKYTVDNVYFYDTMAELQQEWTEADQANLGDDAGGGAATNSGERAPMRNTCKAVPEIEGVDLQGLLNEALRRDEDEDKTIQEYEEDVFAVLKDVFASTNYRDSALKTFCKANDPTITAQKLKLPNEHERKQVLTRLARSLVENEAATRPPPHAKDRDTLQNYLDAKQRGALGGKTKKGHARKHSPSCQATIDAIRAREKLDEWGLPERPYIGPPDWCCSKHREEVATKIAAYVRRCEGDVLQAVGVALDEADRFKAGIVPRATLRSIAEDAVRPLRQTLALERIDEILELADRHGDGLEFDHQKFACLVAREARDTELRRWGSDLSIVREHLDA